MNTASKIYESVLKIQKENNNVNILPMKAVGRKQKSTVDNLNILNSIIENQKENQSKRYL